MNCIIVEDQPPAQRILTKFIQDLGSLQLLGIFSDAISAMDFLKKRSVDLMFLDIHLPRLSGMDFLKSLPNPPQVILTTAFADYALEGYELNVVDYLLKPFSFQRFVQAVAKVPKSQEDEHLQKYPASPKEVFIKSGYEHIKVDVDDIFYIRSDSDYTEIILPEKKLLSSESLRYWRDNLAEKDFIQIHKSYIINGHKIEKIAGNQVYLGPHMKLPIGRAYKEAFQQRYLNNSL